MSTEINFLSNADEVETRIAEYVSEKLGLEADSELFRGALPVSASNALCVTVKGSYAENKVSLPRYSLQVYGRYATRTDALVMMSHCAGIFPCWMPHFRVLRNGGGTVFDSAHNEQTVWCFSQDFTVTVQ